MISLVVVLSWLEAVLEEWVWVEGLDANNLSLRDGLLGFNFKLPDVVGIVVVIADERNFNRN